MRKQSELKYLIYDAVCAFAELLHLHILVHIDD